jgi:hypothetical protein
MAEQNLRDMTLTERRIIDRLFEAQFAGHSELRTQLKDCPVRQLDEAGSLELHPNAQSPSAKVVKRIPVEAEGSDEDGVRVHILLHVVNGKARELEIYKDDGSRIRRLPEPAMLDVVVLPPAPET